MKKNFILALAVCLTVNAALAQTCITENFSGNPVGWTLSQGARITDYNNPLLQCSENMGIITPGVGGNNPCNVRTPSYISTGGTEIQMSFDIFVFDANLKCNTWKDYDCPTSLDVFYFIGTTKHTGIVDQLLPANGPLGTTHVSFAIPVGTNLPLGTEYQIQLEFKFKSGTGNCVQQNTKYIIDNFGKCENSNPNTLVSGPNKAATNDADFSVFPNPANGASELKINTTVKYDRIQLIDEAGKVIRSANASAGTINISGLKKGVYAIRMENEEGGVSITKKIVIN